MQQFIEFFGNNLILFAAAAIILTAIIANEVHGNVTGGKRLSAVEAVRLINDREPVVVDLRAAADFKKGHLMNAINIPAQKIESRSSELGKDKSRPVILYCALGGSSREAAVKLRKLGYQEVYPMRGGMNGWLQSNLPITAK